MAGRMRIAAKLYTPETLAACSRAYDLACIRLAASGVLSAVKSSLGKCFVALMAKR